MRFTIDEDNDDRFHWRLMGDDGSYLAVSAVSFDSAEEALRAAHDVHLHAGEATGTDGKD
jgi:hypothetical protein